MTDRRRVLARGRAPAACSRRARRSSCCSRGGRDSVCLLDVAVRLAGRGAVRALHVNYGLRDRGRRRRGALPRRCARGSGVPLEVERPRRARRRRQPPGVGARRPLRARRRGWRGDAARDRRRPHRDRPGRDDPLPAGRPRPAAGRCSGMRRARRAARAAAARRHARGDRGLLRARAACAWRDDASNDDATPTRATACATGLLPALRDGPPGARRRTSLRTAALLRDEAEVLDEVVDERARRGATAIDASTGCAALPPALAPPRRAAAGRGRRRRPGARARPAAPSEVAGARRRRRARPGRRRARASSSAASCASSATPAR